MTVSWSNVSMLKKRPRVASLFLIAPREKPSQGEITAVGSGGRDEAGKLIPIDVKVGDRVLFGKWSGTEVKLDGEELLIMKESDIMGVLA
jgi:chaperonin GroES